MHPMLGDGRARREGSVSRFTQALRDGLNLFSRPRGGIASFRKMRQIRAGGPPSWEVEDHLGVAEEAPTFRTEVRPSKDVESPALSPNTRGTQQGL